MKFAHFSHIWAKPGMTPQQRYEQSSGESFNYAIRAPAPCGHRASDRQLRRAAFEACKRHVRRRVCGRRETGECTGAACPVYSNRVAPSKAAADVSDWTIARRKGPQPARPYGTPYTRSALAPIVPNGGLLSMSRSDECRRFAAECFENGTNCGGRTKPSYLPANGASVVCPRREKRHAPAAMTIQRIKCRFYLLLPQPLPQPLSKLLPFPAILFVRPPSVRISPGGGIRPRIFGTVLVTVPRGNNHLSRRDVPKN